MAINNVGGDGGPPPLRGPAAVGRPQPAGGSGNPGDAAAATDEVSLTAEAQRLRDTQAALTQEPAFDAARVDALRKAIASGEYHVDSRRLAGRLLDFESELSRP